MPIFQSGTSQANYATPFGTAPQPTGNFTIPQTQQYQNQFYTASQSGLIWVNGENGAQQYPVAKGNTVLLLDEQDSFFYLKSVDLTGIPSIRKFKFEEVVEKEKEEEPSVEIATKDDLDSLKGDFESLKTEIKDFKETVEDLFK